MQLIHGNCLDYLKDLPKNATIVTDPPYGSNTDTDYTRFKGGLAPSRKYNPVAGDNEPFDPAPWLAFSYVALFGYQFFASRLPLGTILVWQKKRTNQLGCTHLSDCELIWTNKGKGCYLFQHVWHGFDRQSERGKTLHPTQKPVELMKWIIEKLKIPTGTTIIDPYMGSGSTGLAALELGFDFVGIELDRAYFDIASERIHKSL